MLNNGIKAENGYVVLPLKEYNKLLKATVLIDNMISLTDSYDGQVAVEIDSTYIYTVAKELYEGSDFETPDRELKTLKEYSVWSSTLTKPVPTDNE